MFATTALAFAVVSLASAAPISAQELHREPPPASNQDPSELAPAPSTWKGAVADSMRLLLIEHTTRVVFQDKTRTELGGPFFRDYRSSLKVPDTWNDGDDWAVNYVGHPIHGAAAGFIWLDHEDGSHDPRLRQRTTGWVDHVVTPAGALAFMVMEDALDRHLIVPRQILLVYGVK